MTASIPPGHVEPIEPPAEHGWCPLCGPVGLHYDEDGCCLGCGADAVGEGADAALAAAAERDTLRARFEAADARFTDLRGERDTARAELDRMRGVLRRLCRAIELPVPPELGQALVAARREVEKGGAT